jgi:hypothetical protein
MHTLVSARRHGYNTDPGGRSHKPCQAADWILASGQGESMRVEVAPEAARFAGERGRRLWVWAARPRVCCWGTPAYMHVATEQPPGLQGFRLVSQADVEVWFRAPAGRVPDVLEVGLRGRRRTRVEAFWDGCRYAL